MPESKKIIIDTDPGHDDAMALLFLFKQSAVSIQAITTVAGNSTVLNATRNAYYIRGLVGQESIPIFSGADRPLKRDLVLAVVHGSTGLAGAPVGSVKYELTKNASQKIVEIVNSNPRVITILTLGPLTNLPQAFLADKNLPSLVKKVVIMGGAIAVPGNKNRVAEFNMCVDPEAADGIFKSSVPKVLVPLDACNDIALTPSDIEKLGEGRVALALKSMLQPYVRNIREFEGASGALMYDPLAAYYLLNPLAYQLEDMDIVIETKGAYTFGMTVAERRIKAEKMNNVKVATRIDGVIFKTHFIEHIRKLDGAPDK
jgi:purine nucleosidase